MTNPRSPLSVLASLLLALAGPAAPVIAQANPAEADAKKDDAAKVGEKKDEKDKKDEKKWDVDAPPGETMTQTIDTDEGTWISVDVSPDGKTIAFDLLGDIYTMPISGGDARPLTSGISWDMQPRFSPDGKRLAFTSDRLGKDGKNGDNIWVIDLAEGAKPRQITAEPFRLVTGPAWSPDGQSIVARKHFTSRRSLGAGEMWLYHIGGVASSAASGVQLTEKPTEQKDVNEPVFSPDGKYLYYSEDASPGQTFEYNKDSNGQIYVIYRLNIGTGEKERYITGAGGACRPTPSPDGKSIAFVRRIGPKTGLHVFDIASGAITPLYDALTGDQQEAWAIHGVYPAFAWTPDSRGIVFYAKGKVRRIDVETRRSEVIPFRVRDTRTVVKQARPTIDPAPSEFDVRMLRWTVVTPKGDKAIYQALGYLYIKDLPNGEPRRLTTQTDHFEFYPSISRDGKHVVYTTWNDDTLGSVRVASIGGGDGWVVTPEPGHYISPVISPDGARIVYQKVGGGFLTSPLWSRDQGVYLAPFKGGAKPELITRNGSSPQFGAASDVVYVTREASDKDADNAALVSIPLAGEEKGKERSLYTSEWATDYVLSPDGRWLAFVERFNVYVAPFVPTAKAIKIGPKASVLPVARASKEAGENVQFSGDSSRLLWSLGPTLYTRDLKDCFSFLEGAPERLPEPTAEGVNIGFKTRHDAPSGSVAIVGGKVVTMKGDQVINDGVVVIESNRIRSVGPRASTQIPAGAYVLDVKGQTVLPGYFDGHAHGGQAANGLTPQRGWPAYIRLAMGVTSIHDPSHDTGSIFANSEMIKAGVVRGPRTFSTGTILYGAAGNFKAEIDSLDDAKFHLRRMQAVGAFSVKSYNQPRRDQRQQVITAARELGMIVVPEGGSTFQHNLNMIVDGHNNIEHTFQVETVYKDVTDLWRGTNVGYTPTLGVGYGGLTGEYYWYEQDDLWKHPRLSAYMPPQFLNPRSKRRQKTPLEDYYHFKIATITKQAIDLGTTVTAGGHGQLPGIDTHWEMWMFVQGGMTPFESLRSGTLHAARQFGMEASLGSIEPGKLADIVVIQPGKDPLANIRDTEFVQYTIANGRVFDAASMNSLAPEKAERRAWFWTRPGADISVKPGAWASCHGCGARTPASWADDAGEAAHAHE